MKPLKIIIIGCAVGLTAGIVSAREIMVEPGGKLATLPAARDAVRAMRAAGETGDIDVILKDGVYALEETVIFGLEDSAPVGAVTRYRAAEGARPLISGGRVIDGWQKTALQNGKVWAAKVPWAKGDAFFHCLYDGENLLPRAKSNPFRVEAKGANPRLYAGEVKHRIDFGYSGISMKQWKNIEDLELYGQPTRKWLVNFLGLQSVNPSSQTARLSVPATYCMFGDDWVIENCIDHLDEPGEWVLNSQEGILYYWPESGTPGEQVIAPALNELIRIEGVNDASLAGTKDQPVEGIVFEGLSFAYADRQQWLPEDAGLQHDWNLWDKANGLVRFRGARNCAIRNCTFRDSGSDGVRMDLFCQEITVENSTFENLGGVGVLLAGYGPGRKDVNRNNTIHNNEIVRVGQLFLHSPGIFVWQSGHNRISNNHIHDLAYTGMVISGVRRRFFDRTFQEMGVKNPYIKKWMFPEGTREHIPTIRWDEISLSSTTEWSAFEPYMHARGNIIEFNEVHDCLKLLHDGNCIYLSANGDGNIVRYNVTYNHPQGAMIRTDDDSHGATVSHNLLFGTISPSGIAIKGLNTSQHNIYVNCTMTTGGAGNTIDPNSEMSRNLFYFTAENKPARFHTKIDRVGSGLDYNLYWHEGGETENVLVAQQKKGKSKVDAHSLAADPLFVDLVHGDFSFKSGSPAPGLGIEPMPKETVAKLGTIQDPFLKRFTQGMPLDVHRSKKAHVDPEADTGAKPQEK
ncbi:right-handed parallel beta-helix repeat-containing protein [Pontiellaceae bacterium B1224]|nr:right-handed parallel beta-helix repeat-containing protein [Pontiellaceae bacterium B1224]